LFEDFPIPVLSQNPLPSSFFLLRSLFFLLSSCTCLSFFSPFFWVHRFRSSVLYQVSFFLQTLTPILFLSPFFVTSNSSFRYRWNFTLRSALFFMLLFPSLFPNQTPFLFSFQVRKAAFLFLSSSPPLSLLSAWDPFFVTFWNLTILALRQVPYLFRGKTAPSLCSSWVRPSFPVTHSQMAPVKASCDFFNFVSLTLRPPSPFSFLSELSSSIMRFSYFNPSLVFFLRFIPFFFSKFFPIPRGDWLIASPPFFTSPFFCFFSSFFLAPLIWGPLPLPVSPQDNPFRHRFRPPLDLFP